jgi:hypothetical protein
VALDFKCFDGGDNNDGSLSDASTNIEDDGGRRQFGGIDNGQGKYSCNAAFWRFIRLNAARTVYWDTGRTPSIDGGGY